MWSFLSVVLLISGVSAVHVSDASLKIIDEELHKECGSRCVDVWHHMLSKHNADDLPLEQVVGKMMKEVAQDLKDFKHSLQQGGKTLSSFLATTKLAKDSPLDVPCSSDASCGALSLITNSCDFPRLAALSVYQAVNLAVHIFAVVDKVLCACVDVFTQSRCFLANAFPPCIAIDPVFRQLFASTSNVWEAVKAATDKCKVVGDPRALGF